MEYINDGYADWIPTDEDIELFKMLLKFCNKIKRNGKYTTLWQEMCTSWNRYCGLLSDDDAYGKYFLGECDEINKGKIHYVPSNTSIPLTWYYDYEKAKGKRMTTYPDF
jgi:hypothetical protein